MNGLIGLISLSALLLAVSGQLSNLSPSYSLTGTIVSSSSGVTGSTVTISLSVDITRELQYIEATQTVDGTTTSGSGISSGNDDATYVITDGVCSEGELAPNQFFPLDSNIWDMFAAGTESPPGTYTITDSGVTTQLTLVNGRPAFITITALSIVTVITITNFENTPPAFSTFSLPSECSQFTCSACYSSAVSVSISITLILTTLLMYLFTTL